jgi:outer membrane protein TolC
MIAWCVSLLWAAQGCNVTPEGQPPGAMAPPRHLGHISPANLHAATTQPAVTVEQATETMAGEVLQASALPSLSLDIPTARAWALEGNLELKVQRVEPSIAAQDVRFEKGRFEPRFRGLASYSRRDGGGQDSDDYVLAPSVLVPLKTGGEVSAGPGFEWDEQERGDSTALDAGFSFSQPLLRDAGVKVNTAGIRIAGLDWEIAGARTKLRIIRTLAEVDRAYWELYAAQQELRVARQQYELAQTQIQQVRKRVEAGSAPRIEIIRAESGVAARLQGIIVAQTLVRRRERELKRLMNRPDLPVDSATEILIATVPDPVGLALDAKRLLEQALAERMELLVLELELAVDEELVAQRRNALLPGLDLSVEYGRHGVGNRFNQALRRLNDDGADELLVEAMLDVPLGNQQAQARLRRARLERFQRLLSKRDQELAITQDVYDALDRFQESWRQIVVARRGVIVATENYRAEQRQFELGLRTSIEVLDAATRLAQAQLSEIGALADYEISKVDLAVATGTLLGQDGVCWEPVELGEADKAVAPTTQPG